MKKHLRWLAAVVGLGCLVALVQLALLAFLVLGCEAAFGQTTNAPGIRMLSGTAGGVGRKWFASLSVSSVGIADGYASNNGLEYGPDTPGTTTCGIQEALNVLVRTNSYERSMSGGTIRLGPGIFRCSGQIVIPNSNAFNATIMGAGKVATSLLYTGSGSNDFVTVARTGGSVDATLNLVVNGVGFYYLRDTNKVSVVHLNYVNEARFDECAFGSWQGLVAHKGQLVYRGITPTNKVGLVGLRVSGQFNNKVTGTHCTWLGLAVGAWLENDHNDFTDCIFADIGMWNTNGVETSGMTPGSLWQVSDDSSIGKLLTNGPCIFVTGDAGLEQETVCRACQFFTANCCVIGNRGSIAVHDVVTESCNYFALRGVDADGDAGMVTLFNPDAAYVLSNAIVQANGTVSGNLPITKVFYDRPDITGRSLQTIFYGTKAHVDLTTNAFKLCSPIFGETNAVANWPTAAATRGGYALVNSNSVIYLLTSTPNSTAWAATNKIAP